jgi:uncharacterized protein
VKKIIFLTILAIVIQASGVWAGDDKETAEKRALCEKGNSTACFKMGERYRMIERDNKTAAEFYVKACDSGYMTGCTNGGILTLMKGTPYSKEFKQARKMFTKACDAGEDPSCFNLGTLNYKEGRQKKALQFYLKACDMGNKAGCAKHKRLSR